MRRILVIRPDRLGDVILSTPVFEALKSAFPEAELTVFAQANVRPLLEGLRDVDRFVEYQPAAQNSVAELARLFKKGDYDCAVVLQTNWRIAAAVYLAGIPVRIGPWSKPHSFLFFNRGLRQHRSRVERHEADYNLQLLSPLGIEISSRRFLTRVTVADDSLTAAREWLNRQGWSEPQPLVAVHPGMGGSALNWPLDHYLELVRKLSAAGHPVLVTGGAGEGELLDQFRSFSGVMVYGGREARDLAFLAGLFKCATVLVAPSTGPLHLAVAVGCRVVCFYPPIRVQSAKRWGPYVQDPGRASVLTPEPKVNCPESFRCRHSLCKSDPCMRSLSVEKALEEVKRQLASATDR